MSWMSWVAKRDIGAGVTIDLNNVPTAQKYCVAVLLGVAIYNALELVPLVYFTFPRYSGLYFWSVVATNSGLVVHSVGFVLNNFQLTGSQTLPSTLTIIGWIPMVYGQSLVLYSRLHLVSVNARLRRWALGMILLNGLLVGVSTVVCSAGANGKYAHVFLFPYSVMERIQVTVFFVQEVVLSGLYVWKASKFLHDGSRRRKGKNGQQVEQKLRTMMVHLILSNVIVVALDITILALQFTGLYFIQVAYKAFVYSAKQKCELGILGRLVDFVKSAAAPSSKQHHHNHHHHLHHQHRPGDNKKNNNDDSNNKSRRLTRFRSRGARLHKCSCGGGDGDMIENVNGHEDDCSDFRLPPQMEREWETTLRNTFGVAMGGGCGEKRSESVKRSEDGRGRSSASGSVNRLARTLGTTVAATAGEEEEAEQWRDHDGHPGKRVEGLFTIASSGDFDNGSRVRGSVDAGGVGDIDDVVAVSNLSLSGGRAVGVYSDDARGAALWSRQFSWGETESRSSPSVLEGSQLRNNSAVSPLDQGSF